MTQGMEYETLKEQQEDTLAEYQAYTQRFCSHEEELLDHYVMNGGDADNLEEFMEFTRAIWKDFI